MKLVRIIFSGIVSALGLFVPAGWVVSCFGVALFAHELYKAKTVVRAVQCGALFGVVYVAGSLIWFWNVLPLDWLGASAVSGVFLTGGSWLAVSIGLGIVYAGLAALFFYMQNGTWRDTFLLPALWVLGEYVQAYAFWLVTWNTESLFGAHFSGTYIGYALASSPLLLQFASFGGIYLLSFIVVGAGMGTYLLLRNIETMRWRTVFTSVCVCTGIALTIYPISVLNYRDAETVRVALVATSYEQDIPLSVKESAERKQSVIDAIAEWRAAGNTADILLFPEGGRGTELTNEEARVLSTRTLNGRTAIIDSGIVSEGEVFFERAFVRDSSGEVTDTYDKLFLVPQGEYTPWLASVVLRIPGASFLRENISRAERSYARGHLLSTINMQTARVGLLFCSDILSPSLYRTLARDGAEVFFNASSLAALHGSPVANRVFLQIARVRAVENGRFLAISSYEAPASVISEQGVILSQTPEEPGVTVLSYDVPRRNEKTPYVRFGIWIVWLSLTYCVLILTSKRYMRGTDVV